MEVTTSVSVIIVLFAISTLRKLEASLVPIKHTWTYELKSVEAHSDNPDLWSFNEFKVERISRGVYAASISFTVNFDIVEGDDTEIEFLSYRSENGVKEYKPIPFKVQRQHLFKYFDNLYKLIMGTLKECSNMPVFEDKFEPPFEKKTYVLDKCQFDQSEFPQHIQDGFYKVIVNGYGAATWNMVFIVEIISEL
ncbi:uncharacterized protein LOC101896989 [Musca domestica]|uniref:Uncharacterized protein LOC101896989 n=1 Tax=Musca domestica TaxID=7370 RepID=A0A9J7DDU3_MUSDO|nr:uncharacterized protein LOC101896989 [Musca domestica]